MVKRFAWLLTGSLLMAQTTQDFAKVYDSYLAAVRTGEYGKTLPLLSTELKGELKAPDTQKEFMAMQGMLAPAKYETQFLQVSPDGKEAEVQVVGTINVPPAIQKEQKLPPTQRLEMLLKFVKEGGEWKWNGSTILGDPDKRARPKDLNMGSQADYKGGSMQMGGQILRVEKQAAGTVVVIRMMDEEVAAFVPAALLKVEMAPGRVVTLRGSEHKTEKLKFWAVEASVEE